MPVYVGTIGIYNNLVDIQRTGCCTERAIPDAKRPQITQRWGYIPGTINHQCTSTGHRTLQGIGTAVAQQYQFAFLNGR